MNTYYTTRDFEFLRNRPVVLESDYACLLASHKKLVEALKLYQDRECSSGLRHINGNVPYQQTDAALREAEAITKE